MTSGLVATLWRASEAVVNQNPSSSHTPHTGRLWGRPDGRTVATQ